MAATLVKSVSLILKVAKLAIEEQPILSSGYSDPILSLKR